MPITCRRCWRVTKRLKPSCKARWQQCWVFSSWWRKGGSFGGSTSQAWVLQITGEPPIFLLPLHVTQVVVLSKSRCTSALAHADSLEDEASSRAELVPKPTAPHECSVCTPEKTMRMQPPASTPGKHLSPVRQGQNQSETPIKKKPTVPSTQSARHPRHGAGGTARLHSSHAAAQRQRWRGEPPAAPGSCHFRLLSPESAAGRLGVSAGTRASQSQMKSPNEFSFDLCGVLPPRSASPTRTHSEVKG